MRSSKCASSHRVFSCEHHFQVYHHQPHTTNTNLKKQKIIFKQKQLIFYSSPHRWLCGFCYMSKMPCSVKSNKFLYYNINIYPKKMEVLICKGIQMCMCVRDPTKEFLRKFLGKFTVVVYIICFVRNCRYTHFICVYVYVIALIITTINLRTFQISYHFNSNKHQRTVCGCLDVWVIGK